MEVMEPEDENREEDAEEGVEGERLKLSEDSEHMKNILDPSLPKGQEIKEHYEMGHAVCRCWCDIRVRARATEWACRRDDGKERTLP
eukprot:8347362-Karenia_brevis.AAC.1